MDNFFGRCLIVGTQIGVLISVGAFIPVAFCRMAGLGSCVLFWLPIVYSGIWVGEGGGLIVWLASLLFSTLR